MDAEGYPSGGSWGQEEDESQVSETSGTKRRDREMMRQPGRRVGCGLREFCWDHRDHTVLCDVAKSRCGSNNAHSSSGLQEYGRMSSHLPPNWRRGKMWGKGVYC